VDVPSKNLSPRDGEYDGVEGTYGYELECYFKDLPVTMCCADQLPARGESRAQSFVVNTVSGDREGPHWVTFHFPKEEPTEFFDSFGRAPETYHRLFQNVIIANGPQYEFKTFRVQPKDCDPCELFTSSNTDTGTLLWNIS
jgi:hypothetical protein